MSETRIAPPSWMTAFDSDWSYYVHGHDPEELWCVDDPDDLDHTRLWMKAIPASRAEDYGLSDDDSDDTVLRDPTTGRFAARMIWVECAETADGAEPFMGCRYRAATSQAVPRP